MRIDAKTPHDAWVAMNNAFVDNFQGEIHEFTGSQAVSYHSIVNIASFSSEGLDMGQEVGYTKSKWTNLVRGYFNKESYDSFIERSLHYWNGRKMIPSIGMIFSGNRTKIRADIGEGTVAAQGGACLLSFSLLRTKKGPITAVIHSRSSEVTQRFYADLIFIYVLLRTMGEELGFTPEEVKVQWIMPRTYQTFYQVLPFLTITGRLHEVLDWEQSQLPWRKKIFKSFTRFEGDAVIKYAVENRIRNFYRSVCNGEDLPNVTPDKLNIMEVLK